MSKEPDTNPVETLREHIKDVRMAMLTTISDGRVVSRPMSAQDIGPDGTLWFLTNVDSHKVREIAVNPKVGVVFVNPGSETYVSVAGTARVTNDRAQIREFWNPFYKAWFEGPDDPAIRVVEVTPDSAEYWITKGGKIVSLVSILVSAVTGKDFEAGENRTIEL
jgi:general stress protein 26